MQAHDDERSRVSTAARAALRDGDADAAVALYRRLVRAEPGDVGWRLRLADALDAAMEPEAAGSVRGQVLTEAAQAGQGLPALAAGLSGRRAEARGGLAEALGGYLAGSDRLARRAPPSLPLPPVPTSVPDVNDDTPLPPYSTREAAQLPPIPLLSSLSPTEFSPLISAMSRRALEPGDSLLVEGEAADALFLVAHGIFEVVKHDDFRGEMVLGRISAGTVIGEMALVLDRPRTATVRATSPAEVIRIEVAALRAIAEAHSAVDAALRAYTSQRLLFMLVGTSPLFRDLSPAARGALIEAFSARAVPADTEIVVEGSAEAALWLVVDGAVSVRKTDPDTGDPAVVARLGAGDVFGEIGLVLDQLASASICTSEPSNLLVLPREGFAAVAARFPEVSERLRELGDARLAENRFVFEDDDFIEIDDDFIVQEAD